MAPGILQKIQAIFSEIAPKRLEAFCAEESFTANLIIEHEEVVKKLVEAVGAEKTLHVFRNQYLVVPALCHPEELAKLLQQPDIDTELLWNTAVWQSRNIGVVIENIASLPALSASGFKVNDVLSIAADDKTCWLISGIMKNPQACATLISAGFTKDDITSRVKTSGLDLSCMIEKADTVETLLNSKVVTKDNFLELLDKKVNILPFFHKRTKMQRLFLDVAQGGAGMNVDDYITISKPEHLMLVNKIIDNADAIARIRGQNGPQNSFATAAAAAIGRKSIKDKQEIEAAFRQKAK